ncbi:MAG: hypothetical protein AB1420_18760, partial [Bacillota bacterium]
LNTVDAGFCIGKVFHCAGNLGDEIVTNMELAQMINHKIGGEAEIIEEPYEAGELIDGIPIEFEVDRTYTNKILNWMPKYSLRKGLGETISWIKNNLWRYES